MPHASRLKQLVCVWAVATAVVLIASVSNSTAQPKSNDAAVQPKQIVVLHSFDRNFEPGGIWSKKIREQLSLVARWPLDVQEFSLVTSQFGNDAADAEFLDYLKALYPQRPPDLILAIGAPAARYVQQHRDRLFPTTPMLLAAVEARRVEPSLLTAQDAVVPVHFDQVALMENILRLLPDTKAIAVIIGNSPPERFWIAQQKEVLGPLLGKQVELLFYNDRPFAEMLKELATLPPHTAIFFQQFWVDGTGAVYGDKDPLARIAEVANAPIFTFDSSYFNGETVGGPMFSPAEGARPTAAVAVRMLEGERGNNVKVPPIEFSTPKYDWRQLRRWNISESRLPPGSEILFREPTAWERYSWQISFIAAVILAQAGLISALLNARHGRRLAEVQSAQRAKELAHVSRLAIAGELTASISHEINQPLGAILTNAETADAILKSSTPDIGELREIVTDILYDDRRASEVIRRLRSLLKKVPFDPKNCDLNQVVRETVDLLSAVAAGRQVEMISFLAPTTVPIVCDYIQLQQVIINLIVNAFDAMKDTPPEERIIRIRTSRIENSAELSVSDGGSGIPEDKMKEIFEPFFTSKAEGMGMGLSIARTIIEAHNGLISARNQVHGGASFRIKLPIAE